MQLTPVKVYQPFELISMDLIGPFPEPPSGFRYILHIIDYFSPATVSNGADDVIEVLDKWNSTNPLPSAVYVDLGSGFENKKLHNYFVRKDVACTHSPSASHKSVGAVEKVNETLEQRNRENHMGRGTNKDLANGECKTYSSPWMLAGEHPIWD